MTGLHQQLGLSIIVVVNVSLPGWQCAGDLISRRPVGHTTHSCMEMACRQNERKLNVEKLKPKAQHEQLLANADKAKIVDYLEAGQAQDITKIAVVLARQCNLLKDFVRLWQMRIAGLDDSLGTEQYIKNIYTNKRVLYRQLFVKASS
jgi:hypothetical protein